MDQENAKAWLPIIQALAEGKPIEKMNDEGVWMPVDAVDYNRKIPDNYRIQPEPKYRPFRTMEECWEEMLKHEPFGWVKTPHGVFFCIDKVFDKGIAHRHSSCRFDEYLEEKYTFIDGTPFGIKE